MSVIKSKIKIGTIREYTEHGLVLGLRMRLKMGKEYIPHSGTELKDTGFTPVLAKNGFDSEHLPVSSGKRQTQDQRSAEFGQQLQIPGGLEQHSCLFPFSLWNLHQQVREKCLMSCLAETAHLQSEVRNEESQGFWGRGAGWNTHTMCPPLTTGTSLITVPPASHLHTGCSNAASAILFQLVSSLGQG